MIRILPMLLELTQRYGSFRVVGKGLYLSSLLRKLWIKIVKLEFMIIELLLMQVMQLLPLSLFLSMKIIN